MSFENLKNSSGSSLEKIKKSVENMATTYSSNDEEDKYWKCEVDKAGNGYAIIRFLPTPPQDEDEGLPWVKYYDHGFQGPYGWYIERSLTSIGKPDPLGELNTSLWNTGIESNKETARKQKRRLHFVSNVYIVKDSKNPENEGKTKLFRYGKKIFEKLKTAMNPQFEDDKPIDPFDLWNGANFKLKIRKVDGYQNYDLSEFESPSPLFDDDDQLKKVWESEYSLKEIIDPKNFKTYEELKKRLDRVLGTSNSDTSIQEVAKQKTSSMATSASSISDIDTDIATDDDSDLEYFRSLVEDD